MKFPEEGKARRSLPDMIDLRGKIKTPLSLRSLIVLTAAGSLVWLSNTTI
jgi:hypothetical protein